MDSFFVIQLQSATIQILESAYIIATSKNIDTIKSRYEFLLERMSILRQGKLDPQYSSAVKWAVARYNEMYYNRPVQDYQLSILANPTDFDFIEFYSNCLVNAMNNYCKEQSEEIGSMKRESAKIKRREKVLETIGKTINELGAKCSSASSYPASYSKLQNLQMSFNITT